MCFLVIPMDHPRGDGSDEFFENVFFVDVCCNVNQHVTSNMFQPLLQISTFPRKVSMLSMNINFCEFVRYTWLSTDEQKPLFETVVVKSSMDHALLGS